VTVHRDNLRVNNQQDNLHETYQLTRVQLITPDDGHRRCPKHIEFRDKIKFWILDASCWLFIRRFLCLSVSSLYWSCYKIIIIMLLAKFFCVMKSWNMRWDRQVERTRKIVRRGIEQVVWEIS
jgi:hypothetical protein